MLRCAQQFIAATIRLLLLGLAIVATIAAATENENNSNASSSSLCNTSIPLKVFILVGQSNMQGHGLIDRRDASGIPLNGTLEWMIQQKKYSHLNLKNKETGEWIKRKDVWIAYNKQRIGDTDPVLHAYGELTAGPYGGDPGDEMQMGPELGFGWTIGDAFISEQQQQQQQLLLIKVAWGGRSLAVDYRPPSSGGTVGLYYKAMVRDIHAILANLTSLFPPPPSSSICGGNNDNDDNDNINNQRFSYDYEIAGFAWHQGWNDALNVNMTNEYETNLANLIRDIRRDLRIPGLPVSIGVTGMCGWNSSMPVSGDCTWNVRANEIVNAQFQVAINAEKYPEFSGTVAAVETRHFARRPPPFSPGIQNYHWMNNCESYWLVGRAMGNAMLELLESSSSSSFAESSFESQTVTATAAAAAIA